MRFDNVNIDHINLAVKDFKEKGFPLGFGPSKYFDVEIQDVLYPPKPIMAYANYYATGEEPINDFSGGLNTDCFKVFERLNIPIIKKTEELSSNDKLYKIKEDFIKEWPIERLKTMTIEEYTNLEKTSFCYWLEAITQDLGSIWGGSAYKFGIFKRKDLETDNYNDKRKSDGEYAWYGKYGNTREEAFNFVKTTIIQIVNFSQNKKFNEIEDIDLGDAFKWKIAFLYSSYNIINIFKHSALKISAEYLGYSDSNLSYTKLNEYILSKKGDQDFFDFAKSLWKVFDNRDEKRKLFENWLNINQSTDSGKVSSYLRAIDILENEFEIAVYNEDDLSALEELYEDLKIHQKDENGKYFYNKAKSYGKGGFYSAAVGMFTEFIRDNPGNSIEEQALINLLGLFGQEISIKYYDLLSEVINKLGVKLGDNKVHYTFRENKKRFGLTFGQKYAVMIEIKNGKLSYGHFNTINPSDDWWVEVNSIQNLLDAKSIIIDSAAEEYAKTSKSGFKKYSSKILERSILDLNYRDNLFSKAFNKKANQSAMKTNYPLNTILYGPPGTGKTYSTILRAAQIIENREIETYAEALEVFKSNLHDRIEFITFHQNYSYEDFIQGLRPETDNSSSLSFNKRDGVFKQIADKALENIKAASKDSKSLNEEARFNIALERFQEVIEDKEEDFFLNDTAYIFEVEKDAFRYTGERWANHTNGVRMKFSDLREFYNNDIKGRKEIKKLTNVSGLAIQHASYFYLAYNEVLKYLPEQIENLNTVEEQNYVIIIDEINRANISRVFGELITLIEPDKRSNGAIPLEAKLPSGDTFIVPSNLYIIGTMNTADKSIALLDIALRRRFEFESLYPKYEIDGHEIYDVDILKRINEEIISSKGHDFQIGHAYFMGDNDNLVERMNKKVIPLLLEYYMNDEKEVKDILSKAGLEVEDKSWPLKITGKK